MRTRGYCYCFFPLFSGTIVMLGQFEWYDCDVGTISIFLKE